MVRLSGYATDCVVIILGHCELTIVNVAILMDSAAYKMASLIKFARKDITTQPPSPEGQTSIALDRQLEYFTTKDVRGNRRCVNIDT